MYNLRKRHWIHKLPKTKAPKNVIHNFLSYDPTEEEIQALSHGLDQHILSHPGRHKINTGFEIFIKIF